jgi:ribose transport system substrate-binding protein
VVRLPQQGFLAPEFPAAVSAEQGAVSIGIAYAAAVGDIDPAKLSHTQRDFYMVQEPVNKDNVDKYIALKKGHPKYTYAQIKDHLFDYIESELPPMANDAKQDQ